MFVQPSDFNTQPYNIPNIDRDEISNNLQIFIDNTEEEVLTKLLGYTLYKEFVEAITALRETQWLVGTTYILDDEVYYLGHVYKAIQAPLNIGKVPSVEPTWWELQEDDKWLLLQNGTDYSYNDETLCKWFGMVKLLVPVIFSKWLANESSAVTGIAVVEPRTENSVSTDPSQKILTAWNETFRLAGRYGDGYNSLYGFLYFSEDGVYDNWTYCSIGSRNIFGL